MDNAYEAVNTEMIRLDHSMDKAGKFLNRKFSSIDFFFKNFLAEAINRSFHEIKTYVENRRHNLLQSLKTTKDYKLKILNDQLNVIISKLF